MIDRACDMIDIVLDTEGATLPESYHFPLMREVVRLLPWFESEPDAGIHPLRGAVTDYGVMLLPRRAKLALRVPARRETDTLALCRRTIEIGANVLRVGAGRTRPLVPHHTLYARLVVAGSAAEEIFLERIAGELATLASGKSVCGRRQTLSTGEREITGFSLMLHELAPEDSLAVQRSGLGTDRKLGCGIFVPHRSAAAVGTA